MVACGGSWLVVVACGGSYDVDHSEGLLLLFSHREVSKIFKMKNFFLCLKIAEIDKGSILGREGRFWT